MQGIDWSRKVHIISFGEVQHVKVVEEARDCHD